MERLTEKGWWRTDAGRVIYIGARKPESLGPDDWPWCGWTAADDPDMQVVWVDDEGQVSPSLMADVPEFITEALSEEQAVV